MSERADSVGAGAEGEAEGGEGYFASVSDLMVGILFVFLLMLTVFALNFRDAEQDQMVERARYEAAVVRASAAETRANQAETRAQEERTRAEDAARRAAEERARAEAERQSAALARVEADRQAARAREQEERATRLLARNQALEQALDAAVARLQAEIRDREQARADLLARLAAGLFSSGVRFQLDQQSGVLRLSEDVPFNTGRSDLTERTRRTVQALADVLGRTLPCFARVPDRDNCAASDAPVLEAVLVEGHTDRQAYGALTPAQSQQENDRLSTARALSVFAELRRLQPALDLLRNDDGQPLLGVSGYGERRPLPEALGSSEADFAQNRRIDLRFILSSRTSDEVRRLIDEIDRLRQQAD
jgi:flagellar motor protein MotB